MQIGHTRSCCKQIVLAYWD